MNEAVLYQAFFAFVIPLFRISGFLFLSPIFSSTFVPTRIRIAVALTMAFVFYHPKHYLIWSQSTAILLLIIALCEVAIGLAMGALIQIIFDALIVAGQIIAMSMGLGFATMIDPQNGSSVPVISQIFALTCFLLFLSIDGHLQMFELFFYGFEALPIGFIGLDSFDLNIWLSVTSLLFSVAMHIALPTIIAILLVQLSFAVISRASPSMNLFAVGFPLTIILGFVFLYMFLDENFVVFINYLNQQFKSFSDIFLK